MHGGVCVCSNRRDSRVRLQSEIWPAGSEVKQIQWVESQVTHTDSGRQTKVDTWRHWDVRFAKSKEDRRSESGAPVHIPRLRTRTVPFDFSYRDFLGVCLYYSWIPTSLLTPSHPLIPWRGLRALLQHQGAPFILQQLWCCFSPFHDRSTLASLLCI